MTDAYREDWDITSKEGSLCFASAIYSRMVVNLNDDVKVKLTDYGRDLLAKKRLTRQPDEAGYTKFQLWELMNIFGEHLYNGCSIPFEFNRILLAPSNPDMNDQLRARVEALEALYETQRQVTLEWSGDVLRRIMELEAGQKPSLSTSLHSYSVGEGRKPGNLSHCIDTMPEPSTVCYAISSG
jgi:hypothetical protein